MASTKILLADDDPVLLAIGAESLRAERYDVVSAPDGESALEYFTTMSFDLMVLDIDMPGINGLAVLEAVRAHHDPKRASTPVIMLTGNKDDQAIKACYDRGATSFISKPVSWLNMTHQVSFVMRAQKDAQSLRETHELVLQASRAKDAAMMTMRHELRSPLHIIKGFTDLLADQLADRLFAEEKQYLNMVSTSVDDMNTKMTRLFLYAEILSGSFTLTSNHTDVEHIIREATKNVSALAQERKVDLKLSFEKSDMSIDLKADEGKMVLAVTELLDNAVKHSPEGAIVLTSCFRNPNSGTITIRIQDKGDGIQDCKNTDLFKPFVQGDDGLTRSSVGLGLGLTVAQSIIACHSGKLEIYNNDEGGLCAALTIPDGFTTQAAVA